MTAIAIDGPKNSDFAWNTIDWDAMKATVNRLQARIVKAVKEGNKEKSSQFTTPFISIVCRQTSGSKACFREQRQADTGSRQSTSGYGKEEMATRFQIETDQAIIPSHLDAFISPKRTVKGGHLVYRP